VRWAIQMGKDSSDGGNGLILYDWQNVTYLLTVLP